MSKMDLWNRNKDVPAYAQKKISGGRLRGMTDIKPQWRLLALTEMFGAIGFGWRYETTEHWTETANTEVSVHVRIKLFVKSNEVWSEGIEGIGGSMLLAKESSGYHHSDEAYKMATTDAISVACKQLGLGATTYMGCDYSKYSKPENKEPTEAEKALVTEMLTAEEYVIAIKGARTADELRSLVEKASKVTHLYKPRMLVTKAKDEAKTRLKL